MRLALCTLSAVLMSGCSWLGSGSSYQYEQGYASNGAYGANCATGANSYGQQFQGYNGGGQCAGGAYGVAGQGYSQGGFGQAGLGQAGYGQLGYGQGGAYAQGLGANQFGAGGAYGGQYAGVTSLGASAPYGSAVGGGFGVGSAYGQNVVGTQYAGGQVVGGQGVQTIQGEPIYVAQPYPAYYGVAGAQAVSGLRGGYGFAGGAAALPFGLELGVGTGFDVGGDIFGEKAAGPASGPDGTPSSGRTVSAQPAISYADAFDNAINYDLTSTYDVSPTTTLLGRIGYSKADGQEFNIGTASEGSVTDAPITGQFSDLEQYTVEGGFRKYAGGLGNRVVGLRPYVGATAGFVRTNDVDFSQTSDAFAGGTGATETGQFIDGGWSPTASGVIGAEYQVGARTAIGVETGIRWSDNLDTNLPSQDRWQVPVKLRGRVSF